MAFTIFHDFPGLENGLPKFHVSLRSSEMRSHEEPYTPLTFNWKSRHGSWLSGEGDTLIRWYEIWDQFVPRHRRRQATDYGTAFSSSIASVTSVSDMIWIISPFSVATMLTLSSAASVTPCTRPSALPRLSPDCNSTQKIMTLTTVQSATHCCQYQYQLLGWVIIYEVHSFLCATEFRAKLMNLFLSQYCRVFAELCTIW